MQRSCTGLFIELSMCACAAGRRLACLGASRTIRDLDRYYGRAGGYGGEAPSSTETERYPAGPTTPMGGGAV